MGKSVCPQIVFSEKEIEKTVTYDNSHLQGVPAPAYPGQMNYSGGVGTSQPYYPVYVSSCFD